MFVIPARFNGPPSSANGGYACGRVAAYAGDRPVSVMLRLPPPLDTPLDVHHDGETVEVLRGARLVATASPAAVDVTLPEPVGVEAAATAEQRYAGLVDHPFPTCFVCGPGRPARDGLGLRPGPVDGGMLATTWTPPEEFADGGEVRPEIVWAALDCPGGWAVAQSNDEPVLLGTLAARLVAPVRPGERYVVTGWELGRDGRKRYAGTAVHGAGGRLHAVARSTWVVLS